MRWSLETQRKFTHIGSTERKMKIFRISSVIAMDYTNVSPFQKTSKNVLRCYGLC